MQTLLVFVKTVRLVQVAAVQSQADCSTVTLPLMRSSALPNLLQTFQSHQVWTILASPPPVWPVYISAWAEGVAACR